MGIVLEFFESQINKRGIDPKVGSIVVIRTGDRRGRVIYRGRCWNPQCRRNLVEAIPGDADSQSLPLGVNTYDAWDNTRIVAPPGVAVHYPACMECMSDRKVYDAVCRDVQNRRSFRRTAKALAKYDANAPTLADWEQARSDRDFAYLDARETSCARHVAIAYYHDTRDINQQEVCFSLKPGPKVTLPGEVPSLIRQMVAEWEARQ